MAAERKFADNVGVNVDYHIDFDGRLYSVPHALIGARVDVRATVGTVEIFHRGARIAVGAVMLYRAAGAAIPDREAVGA